MVKFNGAVTALDKMIIPMTVDETLHLLGADFVSKFQNEMDPIIAPLRKHISKGRPLSLGKELWEYAVTDSIFGAEWNGAGHSLLDVMIIPGVGGDVKSVSYSKNKKETTEASMYQNFNQDAKQFFINKDTQSLWKLYVEGWFNKAMKFDQYYLIGICREKETLNCNLCCFKVTKDIPEYSEQFFRFTQKMMHINGIGDKDFLKIRYYNNKSRLEIQFTKKCWTDPVYTLPIYKF